MLVKQLKMKEKIKKLDFSACYLIIKRVKQSKLGRWEVILADEPRITARPGLLIPPTPLINFEIETYYQKKPKYNDVYSRNNLLKIRDGVWILMSVNQ